MARPVEYTEEYDKKAQEYLDGCVDTIEEYWKTRGVKSDSYERLVRVKLPTIEGLAVYLGIHKDTVYEWEKTYSTFSDVIADLRAIQADRLLNNGLSGDYNPVIAKVLLTKHGYREGIEASGVGGKDLIPENTAEIDRLTAQLNEIHKGTGSSSDGKSTSVVGNQTPD
jgi:DNA-packaging protein gp3